MQDEIERQKQEARLAALKEDLEKWESIKKQLEENFEKDELPKIASELDSEYRRRRDGYDRSEIERRNSPSPHPDGFRERPVITKKDYDDVLNRAKERANREVDQIIAQRKEEYLNTEKEKFLKEQERDRKHDADQEKQREVEQAKQIEEKQKNQDIERQAKLQQTLQTPQQYRDYSDLRVTNAQVQSELEKSEQSKAQEQAAEPEETGQTEQPVQEKRKLMTLTLDRAAVEEMKRQQAEEWLQRQQRDRDDWSVDRG